MKILIVNKFLHPNGGSETYIFKLGQELQVQGHEVQYFGMDHECRVVGNHQNVYTSNMDFHSASKFMKLTYPLKTIYSIDARRKIRLVLDEFKPNVVHLNNFNYQLTPSIIVEIKSWSKLNNKQVRIVSTAHDYQLICPNHMLYNPIRHSNCEDCIKGGFVNCAKNRCIHKSFFKSLIGTIEAYYWNVRKIYKNIDVIICCSEFMKSKMDANPLFATKTISMHNFVDNVAWQEPKKGNYILFFGRYSEEKGIDTLLKVCKLLPDVEFVFAGAGPLEEKVNYISNVKNVGFQSNEELSKLIRESLLTVLPSEVFENCPFTVMESQLYGTPVLGANIGGIPELIDINKTGELFESGNVDELRNKVLILWNDRKKLERYSHNCKNVQFDTTEDYCKKIVKIYWGDFNEKT